MKLSEAKEDFIRQWGELGTNWGINKTKAQIHALLMISSQPMCADQIMEALGISRGNVCMNLKSLLEWGLIYKGCRDDCRKEYYVAEKEMFKIFRQILLNRKKQELEPLLKMMDNYSNVEENCTESKAFCNMVRDIKYFSSKADATLDRILHTNPDWFMGSFLRMIK